MHLTKPPYKQQPMQRHSVSQELLACDTAKTLRQTNRSENGPKARATGACLHHSNHLVDSSAVGGSPDTLQLVANFRIHALQLVQRGCIRLPHAAPGSLQHALQRVAERLRCMHARDISA